MRFAWGLILLNATEISCALVLGVFLVQTVLPLGMPAAGAAFTGLICSSWDYCYASSYLFSHAIYLAFALIPPAYMLSKQLVTTQASCVRYLYVFIGIHILLLTYMLEGLSTPYTCWQSSYLSPAMRDDQPIYSVSHICLILAPYTVWLWVLWSGCTSRLSPSSYTIQWLVCFLGLPILPTLVMAMFFGGLWSLYNDFALLVWSWDYIELFALDNVLWYAVLAHTVLRGYSPLLLMGITLLVLRLFRMSFLESTHHLTGAGSAFNLSAVVNDLGSNTSYLSYADNSSFAIFIVLCVHSCILTRSAVKLQLARGISAASSRPERLRVGWVLFLLSYQTLFFFYIILRVLSTVPAFPEGVSAGGFVFTTYFGYFWFISLLSTLFLLIYPRALLLILYTLGLISMCSAGLAGVLLIIYFFLPAITRPARLLLRQVWPHVCSILLFLCFVALAVHTYLLGVTLSIPLLVDVSSPQPGVGLFTHGFISGLPGWPLAGHPFYAALTSGSAWGISQPLGSLWLFSFPAGSLGVWILAQKYYFISDLGRTCCAVYNSKHFSSCLYAWP